MGVFASPFEGEAVGVRVCQTRVMSAWKVLPAVVGLMTPARMTKSPKCSPCSPLLGIALDERREQLENAGFADILRIEFV